MRLAQTVYLLYLIDLGYNEARAGADLILSDRSVKLTAVKRERVLVTDEKCDACDCYRPSSIACNVASFLRLT